MVLLKSYIFLTQSDTHCIEENAFKIYINHLQKNSITCIQKGSVKSIVLDFFFCWNVFFALKRFKGIAYSQLGIKIFLFLTASLVKFLNWSVICCKCCGLMILDNRCHSLFSQLHEKGHFIYFFSVSLSSSIVPALHHL